MMKTGFGIRDSGFAEAARGGLVLRASNSNSSYFRKFHTESRFVDNGTGVLRIPHPESRIPEFNA
jgi:hypothetical protein